MKTFKEVVKFLMTRALLSCAITLVLIFAYEVLCNESLYGDVSDYLICSGMVLASFVAGNIALICARAVTDVIVQNSIARVREKNEIQTK